MALPPHKQVGRRKLSKQTTEALNRLMAILYLENKELTSIIIDGHEFSFQELAGQ